MAAHTNSLAPDRIRTVEGSFAFLPHRFLRDGFFRSLTSAELRLYVMLVLVADRDGASFYSHQRLCSELGLTADAYLAAREGLVRKDLIATSGTRVQVLSLPRAPVAGPALDRAQQVSACHAVVAALASTARK